MPLVLAHKVHKVLRVLLALRVQLVHRALQVRLVLQVHKGLQVLQERKVLLAHKVHRVFKVLQARTALKAHSGVAITQPARPMWSMTWSTIVGLLTSVSLVARLLRLLPPLLRPTPIGTSLSQGQSTLL